MEAKPPLAEQAERLRKGYEQNPIGLKHADNPTFDLLDKDVLEKQVLEHTRRGYRIDSRSETSVQLTRPKTFSFIWFVLTLPLGFILYLIYYLSKRDRTVYIQLSPTGAIQKVFSKRSPSESVVIAVGIMILISLVVGIGANGLVPLLLKWVSFVGLN